jgi:cation diffusion facilitator CzcD-associated flavoprotein CzcO
MHPAMRDWSYDLAGKNVGIIGNGASRLVLTRFSA